MVGQFDVTRDGRRFLVVTVSEETAAGAVHGRAQLDRGVEKVFSYNSYNSWPVFLSGSVSLWPMTVFCHGHTEAQLINGAPALESFIVSAVCRRTR